MNLDLFINAALHSGLPQRSHVEEPGFISLYVRLSQRLIDGVLRCPVLDIAGLEAAVPGNGAFKALVMRLRRDHPRLPIYIENVLNPKFSPGLERLGFRRLHDRTPDVCFWLEPSDN